MTDHLEASVTLLTQEMQALTDNGPPQDDALMADTEACCWCAALKWPEVTDVAELRSRMIACRVTSVDCDWALAVGGVASLPPGAIPTAAAVTALAAAGAWYGLRRLHS